MLSSERVKQLDSIVLDLANKNASQSDVQLIVNDFKNKFENESTITSKIETPSIQKPYKDLSITEKMFSGRNETSENLKASGHNIIGGVLDVAMAPRNLSVGVAKGALSTVEGINKLGGKALDYGMSKITGQEYKTDMDLFPDYMTEGEGVAQSIGKGVEQIGEFFIPMGFTAKLTKISQAGILSSDIAKASPLVGKTLSLLTRSGILAGEAATVTAAQTGGDKEQMKFNAAISGTIPIVGAVLKPITKTILKPIGEKIQSTLIRPTSRDLADGFDIKNITKYNLGGSFEEMAKNTNNKIVELSRQLKVIIGESGSKINVKSLIDDTEREMTTKNAGTFGINTKISGALKHWKDELAAIADDGIVDLSDAQQMKRSIGKTGAWSFGLHDPDSTAMEAVSNNLYNKFKVAIENSSGADIQGINKQLSELIPIENAIMRRIPVHERNNILSLTDIVTAVPALVHPANVWLFVLNKLSKSGKFASTLINTSKEKDLPYGAVKTSIFGAKEGIVLSEGEQKAAEKIKTILDNPPSAGMSIKDVNLNKAGYSTSVPYKDIGEVSTKILGKLEGKSIVSKQFISDLTNSGDLKQQERDIIRDVLSRQPEGKIGVAKFAEDVKNELLPLKINDSRTSKNAPSGPTYERIALPTETRGNVIDYSEHIFESPIKTSAGDIHFSAATKNYFGHTRIEDMADKNIRRVIEIQSDLYQKGNLEKQTISQLGSGYNASKSEVKKLQQYSNPTAHFRMVREEVKKAAQDGKTKLQFPTGETAMKVEKLDGSGGNDWVIEGDVLETFNEDMLEEMPQLTKENIQKGMSIFNGNDTFTVLSTFNDGEVAVVTQGINEKNYNTFANIIKTSKLKGDALVLEIKKQIPELTTERFSIFTSLEGKIDTDNPIYKFYEKDLGKYLSNKFGAQRIVDDKGVSWYQLDVKPEMANKPVEAFGKVSLGTLISGGATAGVVTGTATALSRKKTITINNEQKATEKDSIIFAKPQQQITKETILSNKLVKDSTKKLFAAAETSGNIRKDWLQLEKGTFDDMKDRMKIIPSNIKFEDIKRNPNIYDKVAEKYINSYLESYGLKTDYDKALWSWRPGYFKKTNGDINKMPDDKFEYIDGQKLSYKEFMLRRKKLIDNS